MAFLYIITIILLFSIIKLIIEIRRYLKSKHLTLNNIIQIILFSIFILFCTTSLIKSFIPTFIRYYETRNIKPSKVKIINFYRVVNRDKIIKLGEYNNKLDSTKVNKFINGIKDLSSSLPNRSKFKYIIFVEIINLDNVKHTLFMGGTYNYQYYIWFNTDNDYDTQTLIFSNKSLSYSIELDCFKKIL